MVILTQSSSRHKVIRWSSITKPSNLRGLFVTDVYLCTKNMALIQNPGIYVVIFYWSLLYIPHDIFSHYRYLLYHSLQVIWPKWQGSFYQSGPITDPFPSQGPNQV
jgi:hypothetical protein